MKQYLNKLGSYIGEVCYYVSLTSPNFTTRAQISQGMTMDNILNDKIKKTLEYEVNK